MRRVRRPRWIVLATLLVFTSSLAAAAGSAVADDKKSDEKAKSIDPTGTYVWERKRGNRTLKSSLRLDYRNGRLTGSVKSRRAEAEIELGKLEGDKISFQTTRVWNDTKFAMKYQGTVTATGIEGTTQFRARNGKDRSRPWKAERTVSIADVLGLWKFKFEGREGETIETSIDVTRSGDKLVGHYKSPWSEHQAEQLTLSGSEFSFAIHGKTGEDSFSATYKGKLRGNSMTGTLAFDIGGNKGEREFVGRRESAPLRLVDIVGEWKLEAAREDGETSESTIAITVEGDKLKGVYNSAYGEREAKKLQLKSDELSFELSGETDRGSFLLMFKGKLNGDTIEGTASFKFGDQEGTRTFKGRRETAKEPEGEKK